MTSIRQCTAGLIGVMTLTAGLGASVARAQQSGNDDALPAFSPVTAERLINSEAEPHNWLMYSGNYSAQRYSGLDQY